jgi:hypothetical protein
MYRRSVLTPKVLHSSLTAYRNRVLALLAERDALRARRAHDLAHFESRVAELKGIHKQQISELETEHRRSEAELEQHVTAQAGNTELLCSNLAAMRARAERAEAELRIERQRRDAEASLFVHQRELWDADRQLLEDRCVDAEKKAQLMQIKRAREGVVREIMIRSR